MCRSNQTLRSLCVAGLLAAAALAPASAEPVVQKKNGIAYVSGGVGQADMQALASAAQGFNLKLTFTDTDGAFIAPATVRVRVPQGYTILEATSDGPVFYADLKPGAYTVEASHEGNVQTRTLNLTDSQQMAHTFRWQADARLNAAPASGAASGASTTTGLRVLPSPPPASPDPAPASASIPRNDPGTRPAQRAGTVEMPAMDYAPGVAYLSGGVSGEQKAEMQALADRYNLRIRMERTDDSLVLDVPVIITDAVGNEYLRGTAAGPWLYVNLPPGVYRVAVRDFGRSQRSRIRIYENEIKHITFTWAATGESADAAVRTNVSGASQPATTRGYTAQVGLPVETGVTGGQSRSTAAAASARLPETRRANGIEYLSGGAGNAEQQAMREVASRYNLHITAAQYDGAYLSDVSLNVIGEQGSLMRIDQAGPLVYARVPAGNYAIVGSHNGVEKRQEIQIPQGRSKQVLFYW